MTGRLSREAILEDAVVRLNVPAGRELVGLLEPDETVHIAAEAGRKRFSLGRGLLAATNKRLLFVDQTFVRARKIMSLDYEELSAYDVTPSAILATLVVTKRDGTSRTFWHVEPLGRALAMGSFLSSRGCTRMESNSEPTGFDGP
jgi:hypothetical protein